MLSARGFQIRNNSVHQSWTFYRCDDCPLPIFVTILE